MHNCLLTGLTLRMVHFGGVSVFECLGTKSPCRNPLSQNLFSAKVAGHIQVNLGCETAPRWLDSIFQVGIVFWFFFAEVILAEEILVRVLWLRGGINIILHGLTSNEGPQLCLLGQQWYNRIIYDPWEQYYVNSLNVVNNYSLSWSKVQ